MKNKIEVEITDLEVGEKERGYYSFKYKVYLYVNNWLNATNSGYYSNDYSVDSTLFKRELEEGYAQQIALEQTDLVELWKQFK